jgi:ubiquitin carboxyl-terminal hydrolase 4/11/15
MGSHPENVNANSFVLLINSLKTSLQLLTLEMFSSRFYKNLDDNLLCGEMNDNDTIMCFELPCNSQQGRTYKKQPEDPFILPLLLCDTLSTSSYPRFGGYTRNASLFGYPSVIVIDRKQATSLNAMYDAVIERLQRWTSNARDLYTWKAGPSEVPTTDVPHVGSMTGISENGDIIGGQDDVPEEGDIVDEKVTILASDNVAMDTSTDSNPRKIGTKQDVFTLRVQSNQKDFGTASGGYASSGSRFETWSTRLNDTELNPALLRESDAFFCEFDENMKAYYFGDERSRWEHARWDTWDEFIHPEYAEAKKVLAAMKNKGITIQDCLEEFTHEEQLGEEDLWYCPRCKKHQQATKKFDLWKAPDVLVVHLKRFSNSRTLRDKIDTFVNFPVEGLDLSDMVQEQLVAAKLKADGVDIEALGLHNIEERPVYDLFGVDEHIGGLGGGHYRAYAQNHVTNKWYHFDDSYVRTVSASEAVVSFLFFCSHLLYKKITFLECSRLPLVLSTTHGPSPWRQDS